MAQAAAPDELLDLGQYRGKVVLLDFWASWCAPCLQSFPWMQQLHERYASQGLVIIAVNLDHERRLADRFLIAQHPAFTVLFDPEGRVAQRYDIGSMPASIILDRSGRVRSTRAGFRGSESLAAEHELAAIIAEH